MVATVLPELTGLSREAQQLVLYADALTRSASKIEDEFWERKITELTNRLLTQDAAKTLAALFQLLDEHACYEHLEILGSMVEGIAESYTDHFQNQDYDSLLICIPFTAWTRFQLPHGPIEPALHQALHQLMHSQLLASDTDLYLHPELVNFEQLPQSFSQTRLYLLSFLQKLRQQKNAKVTLNTHEHDLHLLADVRFILGVVSVKRGAAVFQWQSTRESPLAVLERLQHQWPEQAQKVLHSLFTGCEVHYGLPNAFYAANRLADLFLRPLIIKAAVTWLEQAAQIAPNELVAVIAACGHDQIEEYRVGFSHQDDENKIIYGCIWSLLSQQEADNSSDEFIDAPAEIAELLSNLGVTEIRLLPGIYLPEYCEDCDSPHFPTSAGELVHPELPDEVNLDPLVLH